VTADALIVGAGSAGCVLAARLTEDWTQRVMLLEAGPAHPLNERPDELRYLSRPIAWPYDWGDNVLNADGRRLFYGRGRGLGGSSATNGGVALRPDPEDVEQWPRGWRWDDLLPSLVALEHDIEFGDRPWHGDRGPVPITRWPESSWNAMQAGFVAGCEAAGLPRCDDHNEPGTTGVGPIPMNRVGPRRVSAHESHLESARRRPNLTVRGNAHVRRVRVERGRAVGVELVDGRVLLADHVILAAGVVQDPLLLWRSGIGPADHLRALGIEPVVDQPAVGRHLTDHMVVTYSAEIRPDSVPDDAPSLQTIARATAPGSARQHDLQLTPWARRHRDGRRELGMSISLQRPDGEGTIEPAQPDPLGPAQIRWPFAAIPSNIARLREGWRLAARIALGSGLLIDPESVQADLARTDEEIDALVRDTHTAFYHGVGTCRMGETGVDHVVDTDCHVLGVDDLSVVDASVIPTVPCTNTNLAAMAVADHVATRRRARDQGQEEVRSSTHTPKA
jgi:choline dehydrogenase